MKRVFALKEQIAAQIISDASLTGTWFRVWTPIKDHGSPGENEGEAQDVEIQIIENTELAYKLIYCKTGDSAGELRYLKPDDSIITLRAGYLDFVKRNAGIMKTAYSSQNISSEKGLEVLTNYISGAENLATAKSETELTIKNDVKTKLAAAKDFATTQSELESSWLGADPSAEDVANLKKVYNGALLKKFEDDLNSKADTLKTTVTNYEADSENSDLEVLQFDLDFTSVAIPVFEE